MRDDYPLLRSSLAAPYSNLDPDQLAQLVQALYGPGATPEDVEGFFSDIGRGFKKAAGAVGGFASKALPGMVSGAMTGASVGGPWGALIGAVAGGAGSALAGSKNKTARSIGGVIGGAGNLISTVRGGGAGGGLGSLASIGSGLLGGGKRPGIGSAAPGGGAANALMGLLSRPETLQALLSGSMGSFGKQALSIGGQEVPVHALLSTLGAVAGRAAQEAAELDEAAAESVPAYVEWAESEFGIDADDAEGRSDALLALLAVTPSLWASQNRPVSVNVTVPEPPYRGGDAGGNEAWEYDEAWADGEDFEDWEAGEGWNGREAIHAGA